MMRKIRTHWVIVLVLLLPLSALLGARYASSFEPIHGSPAGLLPCPASPNCVSSLAPLDDALHRIDPFRFEGDPGEAWSEFQSIVESSPRTTVVESSETYLRAEARTLVFGFVDDIECLLEPDNGLIQLRSASRLGHGDLGVKRARIGVIRQKWRSGSR